MIVVARIVFLCLLVKKTTSSSICTPGYYLNNGTKINKEIYKIIKLII